MLFAQRDTKNVLCSGGAADRGRTALIQEINDIGQINDVKNIIVAGITGIIATSRPVGAELPIPTAVCETVRLKR